jgi:hypothetical protein
MVRRIDDRAQPRLRVLHHFSAMLHRSTTLAPPAALRRRRTRWLSGLVVVGMLGCGSAPGDTIEREDFISTYVDLRTAAADTDTLRIGDTERAEVLARHGVTGEDLSRFVEVYAEDLEFMREVWNEVEVRLDFEPETN